MNYKGEIQYVRFYTAGNAVQKLETRADQKSGHRKNGRSAANPVRKAPRVIEPFALAGTVIAVVMAVGVVFGFIQMNRVSRQKAAMENYIEAVTAANQSLQTQYEQGYDLEEVRITAEAMGLVPEDQVQHIKISVVEPVVEPEPTFWESLWGEIQELFA